MSTEKCDEGICTVSEKNEFEAMRNSREETTPNQDNHVREQMAASTLVPGREIENCNMKKVNTVKLKPSITTLHTQQDLDALVSSHDAVIIEFMTSWCGACKGIEEYYEELSIENQEFVRSARIICDKNKQTKKLASGHNVNCYPVFIVFKDGAVVNRWDGADIGKLESTFTRFSDGRGRKKKRGGRSKKRYT